MALFRLIDNSLVITDEYDLLTQKQLVKKLGVSRSTVSRLMRKGMPCLRFQNRRVGYRLKDVIDWMASHGYPQLRKDDKND